VKFLDVTIRNYGSFSGQHPPFRLNDRGLVLIAGRNLDDPRMFSNGAGKSMLVDSIDWCLFGVHPRGDSVAKVVNDQAGGDCEVAVRLVDDTGTQIVVQRTRGVKARPDGVRVTVGGVDRTTHDMAETQRRLEGILGMDRDVFHAAVLFAQFDEWRFADATDAQQKALLTKLIPELGVVDEWLERAQEALHEAHTQEATATASLASIESEMGSLQARDPRTQAQAWEQGRAAELHNLLARRQDHVDGITKLDAALHATPYTNPPEPLSPPPAAVLTPESHAAGAALSRAQEAQEAARAELRALEAARVSPTCPTCRQPLPGGPQAAQEWATRVAATRAAFDSAAAIATTARETKAALDREAFARQAAQVEAYKRHAEEVQRVAHQNTYHVRCRDRRDEVCRLVEEMDRQYAAVTAQQNPHLVHVDAWLAAWANLEERRAAAGWSVTRAQERMALCAWWVTAFGPRGIKSHILDARLQEMTDEANRWVGLLTGGTIWVRFETQTKVGKGKTAKLVDKFSVRVFRHNPDGTTTDRNYKSWCGGEKHRISTGIDFGIARLVAKRASCKYDVLFLDEIFGKHLDAEGKAAVAEMLTVLSKEKSSIFVVDHDPQFQGVFSEIVTVVKRGGSSSVQEGRYGAS